MEYPIRFTLIALFVAGFITGGVVLFFVGRARTEKVVTTEYVRGETVRDTVRVPYPVREEVPVYYSLPVRYDTVYIDNFIYVRETVDTLAIIAEYIVERTYEIDMFDNENGKMTIWPVLQYNRLKVAVPFEFTPLQRVDRSLVVRTWVPFVASSYSTFGTVGVGGGIFYHNIAGEYQYLRSFDGTDGHLIGLKYKF